MEASLERSVHVDVEGPEGVRVANNKDMEKLTLGIPRCVQGLSRDGAGLEHDRGSWRNCHMVGALLRWCGLSVRTFFFCDIHVRSEDSEETTNRACNTTRDNKRGQVQHMDDAQTLCVLRSQPLPQPTRWMSRLHQATC